MAAGGAETLAATSLPSQLRRNHVAGGYRPLHRPRRYYVASAFCWHNEVVNVWRHLLPLVALYALYVAPEWSADRPRAAALLACSALTHLMVSGAAEKRLTHVAHSLQHSRSPLGT